MKEEEGGWGENVKCLRLIVRGKCEGQKRAVGDGRETRGIRVGRMWR